jgi:hypothetical protein
MDLPGRIQLNSNAPWYGYGIELWGIGTNASYNTIEGYWGNGISFGSSQTGKLTVDYNTLCGPTCPPTNLSTMRIPATRRQDM